MKSTNLLESRAMGCTNITCSIYTLVVNSVKQKATYSQWLPKIYRKKIWAKRRNISQLKTHWWQKLMKRHTHKKTERHFMCKIWRINITKIHSTQTNLLNQWNLCQHFNGFFFFNGTRKNTKRCMESQNTSNNQSNCHQKQNNKIRRYYTAWKYILESTYKTS